MAQPKIKRRKRAIPGKSEDGKKVMVYLYISEHAEILRAAIKEGTSVSGYMATAAIEKARRDTSK